MLPPTDKRRPSYQGAARTTAEELRHPCHTVLQIILIAGGSAARVAQRTELAPAGTSPVGRPSSVQRRHPYPRWTPRVASLRETPRKEG